MREYFQFALITFTSILFIVDPIAVIPTYLVITSGETPDERKETAFRACLAAGIAMAVFALAGRLVLNTFGITIPAFRIAGGFILWLVAMDMLRGQRSTQETTAEVVEGQEKEDVSITPLAVPMLAGPGAISTVMVLSGQARGVGQIAAVYISIALTAVACWIALRVGERLLQRIGRTGVRIATRLMGLLLAAVAVQFVINGIIEAIRTFHT
ncbi:MAG TPA: MarC family protein [Gemmatimonadaceae bacterium]|nr:MarC family protein [Gemmatimonadaceae bacterium]